MQMGLTKYLANIERVALVAKRMHMIVSLLLLGVATNPALADPDPARGQQMFGRTCVYCHSLEPDQNMTGPSLSGLWGRRAGSLPSFKRYSPALKSAKVQWGDQTLDQYLADPKAFIPGNRMAFPGLKDDSERADLIAFLKKATQRGGQSAKSMPGMKGMMGMGAGVPNLRTVPPGSQVKEINTVVTLTPLPPRIRRLQCGLPQSRVNLRRSGCVRRCRGRQ